MKEKPKQLWVLKDAVEDNAPDVLEHEPTRHTSADFYHMIEAKNYFFMVKALINISKGPEFSVDGDYVSKYGKEKITAKFCKDEAKMTLMDIGEWP